MAKKRANGEGNIRKRADGRWEGRYTAGYNSETGKRIIKNVLGKTQAECKAKLAAAMEATKGVDVSRADEYTVATWLRSWYDIYAKPNVRVATADRYRLMIEQYAIPRIGSIKLTKLTAHDLQKLYKELMESGRTRGKSGHGNPGLSSTTVRSLHLMLHNALNRAVKERLILRNPTEDCIAPKVQKFEMQILQPEHIKTYLDAADKRGLLPMFYLELVSGLRKGELTALLWSDLDIQNKTISVSKQYVKNPNGELTLSRPKTETSVRKVSIPQEAVDLLVAEHKKHPDNPYMFPSPVTGAVLPRLHRKPAQEDPEGRRTAAHQISRSQTYLRNAGTAKRRGRQNRQQHAGPLRCGLHSPHLHPRYPPEARRGRTNYGQLYDAGDVSQSKRDERTEYPSAHLLLFPRISACGSRCGSGGCPTF